MRGLQRDSRFDSNATRVDWWAEIGLAGSPLSTDDPASLGNPHSAIQRLGDIGQGLHTGAVSASAVSMMEFLHGRWWMVLHGQATASPIATPLEKEELELTGRGR